ncbi:MAG: peroxidase family protein [Vulcanimicrobiaceae bacterium]
MARDASHDGLGNTLETYLLTHFDGLWRFVADNPQLAKLVNKTLIDHAIYKVPTRPFPFSLMTLDPKIPGTDRPKKTDTYTSWDSLNDRTYTGRHLPPDPAFNADSRLPKVEDLAVLFRKRDGETVVSEKSTLLFPYWVQWFTDGFLRTDRENRLKNTSNHQIDVSPVYGLTPKAAHMLRSFSGGKLKSQTISGEEYPPFFYSDAETGTIAPEFSDLYVPFPEEDSLEPARKALMFAMGVERANIQIGFVMLNVLFLREHNRVCELLAKAYPAWDDERLFQTARVTVMATIMKIVIDEYINHITPYRFKFMTDPLAFKNERWYRQNWMTVEFTLVYRWHSALPDSLQYGDQQIPMAQSLWNNGLIVDKGLGELFEETSSQPAAKIGLFNTDEFLIDVTELMTVRLGRMAQLASYNDYRAMCGFPRVTAFDQITGDPVAQRELARLYGHVDNLEFYVGLCAEDVRENSALAPLAGRLVGIDAFSQALTSPLLAPQIFNERTFSPVGWQVLNTTSSLSDVVNRNVPSRGKAYKVSFYR